MQTEGWTVRAHSSRRDAVSVFARKHAFEVGAPIHFDTEYDSITALEYVLGAVAADVIASFRALAHKRRLDVDQVEATVHGTLSNPLVYLGVVGETGEPTIETLAVRCYVSSLDDEASVRGVWDDAIARSPLARTFMKHHSIDIAMQVVI